MPNSCLDSAVSKLIELCERLNSIKLRPYQKIRAEQIFEHLLTEQPATFTSLYSRKSGKALALDTPIPTPDGWTSMEEITVGDIIFDEKGKQCCVDGMTEKMFGRPCYEVCFADGTSIVADANHLWKTRTRTNKLRKTLEILYSTKEIANSLLVPWDKGIYNHAIPVPQYLQIEQKKLPFPPFTLGVWLGDGSKNSADITVGYENLQIVQEIRSEGIDIYERSSSNENSGLFHLGNGDRTQAARNCSIQALFRKMGLLNNKHIPMQYLRASVEDRFALLQGLIDSDGHITTRGYCEFDNCNKRLAKDVVELVRSLGFRAKLRIGRAKLKDKDCGPKYRIAFWPFEIPVCRLKRKLERQRPRISTQFSRTKLRSIIAVNPVRSVPVKCIQVNSESGLFLAGKGMVPTHNSLLARCVTTTVMIALPELSRSVIAKDFPRLKEFADGFFVCISGPKLNTARQIFLKIKRIGRGKIFKKCLQELDLETTVSNSDTFELSNGSIARAFSGSPTASADEESAHLLILDEAQRLSPYSVYKILRPLTAATGGLIWNLGTPGLTRCPFLRDIRYNQQHEPHLDQQVNYLEAQKYSTAYQRYIQEELKRLPGGEENEFFKMNFLLEWLLAEGHFIDPDNFDILKRDFKRGAQTGGRLTGGIDWGKVDSATVVTILEERNGSGKPDYVIIDWLYLKGDSYEEQYDFIEHFLAGYDNPLTYSESRGEGSPATEQMQKRLGTKVIVGKCPTGVYNDRIHSHLGNFCKIGQFGYCADGSLEARMFEEQMLDAVKETKAGLLCVHKSEAQDEYTTGDDFLDAASLALDAALSEPDREISFASTGQKRSCANKMADF